MSMCAQIIVCGASKISLHNSVVCITSDGAFVIHQVFLHSMLDSYCYTVGVGFYVHLGSKRIL